jgi:tellurite resistance protein
VAALLGWPVMMSHALGLFTLAVFAVLLITYLAKIARFPEAARNELNHPVMSAFVPTISISMLLLAVCMLPLWPAFATWLWGLGTALHLILTLHIVRSWIDREHFQLGHINPAWFIPAVGNVVVPLAGAQLGQVELSWFFFAVGVSFWIILLVIVFYRILFHDPLPPNLLPTLFILIAPPAVGFLAYMGLTGGRVDAFARILYYLALFFTLLLVIEFPRFARLPFFLSWWAYSFPSAAVTAATFVMAGLTRSAFLHRLALVELAVLSLLLLLLLVKTAQAILAGRICVPPPPAAKAPEGS